MKPIQSALSRSVLAASIGLLVWRPAYSDADVKDPKVARAGDEYVVVDCLFPGAVRRLGARVTFIGRRTAARVSARDCQIRGGEYVEFDRSNYATALAVWRPLAESGDATAQTYLGDIFAKGLGQPKDFAEASRWYQKAAAQGFAPAQFALGMLYENGRGVSADKERASLLYRQAAGRPPSSVGGGAPAQPNVVSDDGVLKGDLERARSENSKLTRKIAELEEQVTRDRTDLEARNRSLDVLRKDLAAEQATLRDQEKALADAARERAAKDRAAEDRAAQERAARERAAQERAAQDRAAQDHAAQDHAAQDHAAQDQAAQDQAAKDRAAQERAAQDRLAEERAAQDRAARERAAQDRAALDARQAALDAREKDLKAQEQKLAAQDASVRKAQADLERLRSSSSERSKAAMARPAPDIEIILSTPQLQQARGETGVVIAPGDVRVQRIAGVVRSSDKIKSVTINATVVPVTADGLFESLIALPTNVTDVAIEASDSEGHKGALNFQVRRRVMVATRPAPPESTSEDVAMSMVRKAGLRVFRAVLIANESYQRPDWQALSTPISDVEAVATVLREKYGFSVTVVRNGTREDILKALYAVGRDAGDDDSVLVYYAGHGEVRMANATDEMSYWVPVDGAADDTSLWLSSEMLQRWVSSVRAKKVMIIADSCFAGGPLTTAQFTEPATYDEDAWRTVAGGKTRVYFTSGGDAPVLDRGGKGNHSVFASELIDVLSGNSGALPGSVLFQRVGRSVLRQSEQHPDYQPLAGSHAAGDFVFVPLKS